MNNMSAEKQHFLIRLNMQVAFDPRGPIADCACDRRVGSMVMIFWNPAGAEANAVSEEANLPVISRVSTKKGVKKPELPI